MFHHHELFTAKFRHKDRLIKFLFCLKREVSSHNESAAVFFSALRSICIKARRLNVWVGNWRERVVSLGAPDARVLAFIALGERFSPGRFTLYGYRWVVHML